MTDTQRSLDRIAEIDKLFDGATAWGGWMVAAAKHAKGRMNENHN